MSPSSFVVDVVVVDGDGEVDGEVDGDGEGDGALRPSRLGGKRSPWRRPLRRAET